MTSASTSRLLELLSLLQARRDWPGAVLADRLGVSARTVRRDVDRLRDLGYGISSTTGPDGGYCLDPGRHLPPLLFDDDQAVALAVALQLAARSGAEIGEGALRALTTVRQVLPARLRPRLDALTVVPVPDDGPGPQELVPADTLLAVAAAIRSTEVLRFDHVPADRTAEPTPRRVEPHHLLTLHRRWYLLAWDMERDDWRIHRVDRMRPKVPTGPRFSPRAVPGGDPGAYLRARFKGSAAADTWPCTGTVVLDLPARRVLPHVPDGAVTALPGDRCRVELGSWSWASLAAALSRFDTEIEVEGPAELRNAFALLAARSHRAAAR